MRELIGWLTADVGAAMRNLIWKLHPEVCVEIGVFAGKSLINTALQLKENGHGIVYGIDPWRREVALQGLSQDEEESSPQYWSGIDLDAVHWDCMRAIWQRDLENVVIIRAKSEQVVGLFREESIDILYIDGGHAEPVALRDADLYLPKVKSRGHIWMDDTNYESLQKAVKLVEEQMSLGKGFWSRPVVQEELKPVVIVQRGVPLTEHEIDQALLVSEETQWWRALVQLIEQYRNEYAQSAWQCSGKNNALALASDVGAHEALSGLLVDLEKRRSGD